MRILVSPVRSAALAVSLIGSVAACSDDDDDPRTLMVTIAEPFGENCAVGGTRTQTGRDRNLNGRLDDDEITSTTYDCATPTSQTAAPAMTQADIDALANVNVINGDLRITGSSATLVNLPNLVEVTGSVYIANNPGVTAITLPALAKVGGGVDIDENAAATAITLSGLSQVTGHLLVAAASNTTTLNLGALRSIGGDFALSAAGSATTLQIPSSVGADVTIDGVPSSALTFTGGSIGGDLSVSNNPALTSLTASGVTIGGYLFVQGNRALSATAANQFATATGVQPAKQSIKNNAL
jgi:hypothetical protein